MSHPIKVFAPAAVGNVGVGFDVLGFAINGPGDDILVKKGNKPGLHISRITGARGKLPLDPFNNTATFGALKLMQDLGLENEPLDMEIRKKMPMGSGLGSSSASAVGGVFAVSAFLDTKLEKSELLKYCMEGEYLASNSYQADNVAPCLLGGMVLVRDNKTLDCKKLFIPPGITVAVIFPQLRVLTKESRAVLNEHVTLQQHIQQSGNLAALVAGFYTGDFGLIKRSLDDVIIEPQRAHLIPYFYDMKEIALELGALGFSISGSGPSMFALCDNTFIAESIVEKAKALYKSHKIRIKTYLSEINHEGAFIY
jgi:homoserine kinase